MVIAEIFDALFGWTLYFGELYGLIIISFILTLLSTLAYKFLTDQKALKALKEETKEINKKIRENKSNPEKLSQLQSQAMQKSFEQMKHSFRPILFTFIPFLLVFIWLRQTFEDSQLNFLGFINSWIWTYILLSIVFSIVLRKVLKVH